MKTKFLAALLAAAAIGLIACHPARADATPDEQSGTQVQTLETTHGNFYRQLDAYANAMSAMELARRVEGEVDQDPSRLSIALGWVKNKVSTAEVQKVNSLYFLIYADMAMRSAAGVSRTNPYYMAYSKAAYQALVTFEALFLTDAARCVNPDAGKAADALLQRRYARLAYVPATVPPEDMAIYWKTALTYEAAVAARPGNAEICTNAVALALAESAGRQPPEQTDARYIDASKWTSLRGKIRADLAARWQADYAPAQKAYEARKAKEEAAAAAALQKPDPVAAKKAAEAAKEKAEEEALAREKQERLDAQKREQAKYHDTFEPDYSSSSDDDSQ